MYRAGSIRRPVDRCIFTACIICNGSVGRSLDRSGRLVDAHQKRTGYFLIIRIAKLKFVFAVSRRRVVYAVYLFAEIRRGGNASRVFAIASPRIRSGPANDRIVISRKNIPTQASFFFIIRATLIPLSNQRKNYKRRTITRRISMEMLFLLQIALCFRAKISYVYNRTVYE